MEASLGWEEYVERFSGRADAVYRPLPDGTVERLDPSYHERPEQVEKDLSGPILILERDCAWYFGGSAVQLPEELEHLAGGGRGHRTEGVRPGDPERFETWLRAGWNAGVHQRPRHGH